MNLLYLLKHLKEAFSKRSSFFQASGFLFVHNFYSKCESMDFYNDYSILGWAENLEFLKLEQKKLVNRFIFDPCASESKFTFFTNFIRAKKLWPISCKEFL